VIKLVITGGPLATITTFTRPINLACGLVQRNKTEILISTNGQGLKNMRNSYKILVGQAEEIKCSYSCRDGIECILKSMERVCTGPI
jgi:hypothetical protein